MFHYLLDIYIITFRIILTCSIDILTITIESINGRRTSTSAIKIYIRYLVIISLILEVLPTVLAHPPSRSHHNLLDLHTDHLSQQHLLDFILLVFKLILPIFTFIFLTFHIFIKNAHTINNTYLHTLNILYVNEPFIYTLNISDVNHTFTHSTSSTSISLSSTASK